MSKNQAQTSQISNANTANWFPPFFRVPTRSTSVKFCSGAMSGDEKSITIDNCRLMNSLLHRRRCATSKWLRHSCRSLTFLPVCVTFPTLFPHSTRTAQSVTMTKLTGQVQVCHSSMHKMRTKFLDSTGKQRFRFFINSFCICDKVWPMGKSVQIGGLNRYGTSAVRKHETESCWLVGKCTGACGSGINVNTWTVHCVLCQRFWFSTWSARRQKLDITSGKSWLRQTKHTARSETRNACPSDAQRVDVNALSCIQCLYTARVNDPNLSTWWLLLFQFTCATQLCYREIWAVLLCSFQCDDLLKLSRRKRFVSFEAFSPVLVTGKKE